MDEIPRLTFGMTSIMRADTSSTGRHAVVTTPPPHQRDPYPAPSAGGRTGSSVTSVPQGRVTPDSHHCWFRRPRRNRSRRGKPQDPPHATSNHLLPISLRCSASQRRLDAPRPVSTPDFGQACGMGTAGRDCSPHRMTGLAHPMNGRRHASAGRRPAATALEGPTPGPYLSRQTTGTPTKIVGAGMEG